MISLYFGRTLFWVFSFVHKIVLFGSFRCFPSCQKPCSRSCFLVLSFVHCSPLSKHRALDRVFWCSPSWTHSWFLLLSLVPKIVLFVALPCAKNRALDRAFWCSPSCQKSCFLVLVLFGAFPRAKNRRSCFLVLSFVPQIVLFVLVLFGAFPRAKNRRSCFLVLSFVPKIVL